MVELRWLPKNSSRHKRDKAARAVLTVGAPFLIWKGRGRSVLFTSGAPEKTVERGLRREAASHGDGSTVENAPQRDPSLDKKGLVIVSTPEGGCGIASARGAVTWDGYLRVHARSSRAGPDESAPATGT